MWFDLPLCSTNLEGMCSAHTAVEASIGPVQACLPDGKADIETDIRRQATVGFCFHTRIRRLDFLQFARSLRICASMATS